MQRFTTKRKIVLGSLLAALLIIGSTLLVHTGAISLGDSQNANDRAQDNSGAAAAPTTANGQKAGNSQTSGNAKAQTDAGTVPTATATPSANAPAPASSTIRITKDGFTPGDLTVKKNTPVAWVNDDTAAHALDRADGSDVGPHSPQLGTGQSFTYSYARTGTFKYVDVMQPAHGGSVTVTE